MCMFYNQHTPLLSSANTEVCVHTTPNLREFSKYFIRYVNLIWLAEISASQLNIISLRIITVSL